MPTIVEHVALSCVFFLCCGMFLRFQDAIALMKNEATVSTIHKLHTPPIQISSHEESTLYDALLAKQVRVYREFQSLIRETQIPSDCGDARILLVDLEREYDGFALETRAMSLDLLIAVATGRSLVIDPDFTSAYAPKCNGIPNPESSSSDEPVGSTSRDSTSNDETDETISRDSTSNDETDETISRDSTSNDETDETISRDSTSNDETDDETDETIARDFASMDKSEEKGGHWTCLWNQVSNCTQNRYGNSADYTIPVPMGEGIISGESIYFDVKYFGPERIVKAKRMEHFAVDSHNSILPVWERLYSRFWIRAQTSNYLWKHQNDGLRTMIDSRLPHDLLDLNEPFIGFHIRMTDNVADLQHDFGRNATVTRSFERFMQIANNIRSEHPSIRHIYVATDNIDAAYAAVGGESKYPGWTFHVQRDVVRTDVTHGGFMWFSGLRSRAAGAIGADIETLRRADFLVGSFQSNVYRLATELNTVYHTSRYLWDENRHHTVDVEWYEDP